MYMATSHEEADVTKPQQVQKVKEEGYQHVTVVCDDNYVFVLLLYYYYYKDGRNIYFWLHWKRVE